MLSLANSAEKPSETPLSTWKVELFEQRRLRVLRDPGLAEVKKKLFSFFFCEEVYKNGITGSRLADGAGEERVGSSGSNP